MLRFLIILGIIEGLSTLALVFVAMPLKYFYELPEVVTLMGSIHGFLFILYLHTLFATIYLIELPKKVIFWGTLAALLPFGPFVLDRWLLRPVKENRFTN